MRKEGEARGSLSLRQAGLPVSGNNLFSLGDGKATGNEDWRWPLKMTHPSLNPNPSFKRPSAEVDNKELNRKKGDERCRLKEFLEARVSVCRW